MKRSIMAVTLLLVCQTARAAVTYEFRQVTNSQVESIDSVDFTGRAVIDGDRSRVEILTGSTYMPGTYVISSAHHQYWVDPTKKSYVDINGESVANAIGASKITIENVKHEVTKLDDHPHIAGIETDHYRIRLTYDVTVAFGTIPLKQSVQTTIDKWTTMQFGEISETFLLGGAVHTGNPQLDEIIDIETTKVKGFALRQTVSVTTVNNMMQAADTKLPVDRTRTQTSELVISSIKATEANPALFTVPLEYQKSTNSVKETPMQTLSMQPPSQ